MELEKIFVKRIIWLAQKDDDFDKALGITSLYSTRGKSIVVLVCGLKKQGTLLVFERVLRNIWML